MGKYAEKDKNGNIIYKEISDRKKCLTRQEWKSLIQETRLKDHVFKEGTDFKDENGRKVSYFWAVFNYYAGFPLTVAEIHSRYGRGVEINTLDMGYPNCELRIRAYHNWK